MSNGVLAALLVIGGFLIVMVMKSKNKSTLAWDHTPEP